MTKRYFHVAFHFMGHQLTKELEPVFAHASEDWVRYAANCWVVWTAKSASELFNAIKPFIGPNDQMLILEIKSNQDTLQGWLPEWLWNWFNKIRN